MEPFIPDDMLVETAPGKETTDWYAKAMRLLASQLGAGNDFYYPLIGTADILERIEH